MNKLVERAYRKLKVVDMSLHMIVLESMLAPHEITNVTGSAILVVVWGDIRCLSFIALTKTIILSFVFLKLVNEVLVSPCPFNISLIYFFAWKKGVICISCINFDPDCISIL